MSDFVVPTRTDLDNYQQQVTLQGADYIMVFAWNYRGGFWNLDLQDANGNPLLSGQPVLVGVNLLGQSANHSVPPGILLAIDTSGVGTDPGLTDLGNRVLLMYREQ